MTAFELKIEVALQKTFLSLTASLLNCLLLSKKLVQQGKLARTSGNDLLVTWNTNGIHQFTHRAPTQSLMHQKTPASGVFSEDWLNRAQSQGVPIVAVAFEVVRSCQQSMLRRHN